MDGGAGGTVVATPITGDLLRDASILPEVFCRSTQQSVLNALAVTHSSDTAFHPLFADYLDRQFRMVKITHRTAAARHHRRVPSPRTHQTVH